MSCSPGEILGCSTADRLSYCSELGVPLEYRCMTSCSSGACDVPNGDICEGAIPLSSGDTVSGTIGGSNAVEPGVGAKGARYFYAGDGVGADNIYSVELQSGELLEVCDENGVFQSFPCDGGCNNAACSTPSGDVCADSIPLQSGDIVEGAFDGADTLHPESSASGACYFPKSPIGKERIYSVDLAQGERLDAKLVSSGSAAMMYVLSDCTQADSCLGATPRGGTLELDYTASQAETVYLVVDLARDAVRPFRLSVTTQFPGCTPGDVACMADGKSLGRCTSKSVFDPVVCQTGCTARSCDAPSGDVCFDAVPVVSGDSVTSYFGGVNTLDPGDGTVGGCDLGVDGAAGRDTIYSVAVEAGDILEARLSSQEAEALIYVVEDCERASSCAASALSGTLRYHATYTTMRRTPARSIWSSTTKSAIGCRRPAIRSTSSSSSLPVRLAPSLASTRRHCSTAIATASFASIPASTNPTRPPRYARRRAAARRQAIFAQTPSPLATARIILATSTQMTPSRPSLALQEVVGLAARGQLEAIASLRPTCRTETCFAPTSTRPQSMPSPTFFRTAWTRRAVRRPASRAGITSG